MREYRLAVFIGRFQPFHKSHLHALMNGLSQSDYVLFILGSAKAAPSIKNPFSPAEREAIIRASVPAEYHERLFFAHTRDVHYKGGIFYSDIQWATSVNSIVDSVADQFNIPESEIGMIGAYKDESSYYLDLFDWPKILSWGPMMNATDVRNILFNPNCGLKDLDPYLTEGAVKWLADNYIGTPQHERLVRERNMVENYKLSWAGSPFPPTFVTTDAVVVKIGHILLIKRKYAPGEGLWALPGGFLKQNERLADCAIRELKEETRISVPAAVLRECVKESRVFDYPGRSTRGRTITHGFLIDLGDEGMLPKVKGSDDASGAKWFAIEDINETEVYEDHYHIIQSLLSK